MKKAIFLISAFAVIIALPAFKNGKAFNQVKSSLFNHNNSKVEISEITLTVTCLTNRTQSLGGSFQHKVKLLDGTSPVINAQVLINDPIGRVCTSVTTDSNGEAIWNRSIPSETRQQPYTIEFYYKNIRYYSTIAVTATSAAANLPGYSISLNSASSLDNKTLVMASRGGFASTIQSINTTLKEAVQFGVAVAKDYLSNPFSIATVTVAFFSCSAGQLIPGAGQATCLVSAGMVESGLAESAVKILGNKLIDASDFLESDKKNLKNMLELSTIAYSVATLNPAEGLSNLDALGSGYDFVKNAYGQLIYDEKGVLKGASFPAQKKGSNEVYMMCIYNRDAPNQTTNQPSTTIPPSKDSNCKENNNGDYCFQNNTKLDLKVTLWSSPGKITNRVATFTCTLQPGQRQCFFDVPAGAARYEIDNYGYINVTTQYFAEGSLYVASCQENIFFINPDVPSYSTNIPAQTSEIKNQTSKDVNCKENNNGDYCFQNNTKLDLKVTLWSSPGKITNRVATFTCTLQPGQRQCFFDVPAGAARYEINNYSYINVPKQYFAEGSLYTDPCRENTFAIK